MGYALYASDRPLPWHRVINARGEISPRGDSYSEMIQYQLLANEGVEVRQVGAHLAQAIPLGRGHAALRRRLPSSRWRAPVSRYTLQSEVAVELRKPRPGPRPPP